MCAGVDVAVDSLEVVEVAASNQQGWVSESQAGSQCPRVHVRSFTVVCTMFKIRCFNCINKSDQVTTMYCVKKMTKVT